MNFSKTLIPDDAQRSSYNKDLDFMRKNLMEFLTDHVDNSDWADFVQTYNKQIFNSAFRLELPERRYEIECSITIELSTTSTRDELEDSFIEALESAAADVEYCDAVNASIEINEY